jgi:hypothetical protein
VDLHLTANVYASQVSTDTLFILSLMALAFVIYILCAFALHHQPAQGNYRTLQRLIWLTAIIAGGIFIITPAMLSHDIYAYAAYGRMLAIYHTNPYFINLTSFPHDPFYIYDDWKQIPSAYGPVWEALSGLTSQLAGVHIGRAILLFRILAFIPHLLNAFLIVRTLRTMGRSPRTVTLGMLLYLLNPLILEESSFGGHNDAFMLTPILLGIFFIARTEYNNTNTQSRPRLQQYWAPAAAFALASLIKFSALPVLALYLVYLASKTYHASFASSTSSASPLHVQLARVRATLQTIIPAGAIGGALILVLYAPFWIGHNLTDIYYTFNATPSNASSYGSVLFALVKWIQANNYPPTSSWIYPIVALFSFHKTWSIITLAALVLTMIISSAWLWRTPTVRTMALGMVITLGLVLVVTYWFFPWYLTWIIAPIVLCLPMRYRRLERALLAFTLVFTLSAFSFYLYAYNRPPFGGWSGISELTTLGPPLLAFIIFLLMPLKQKRPGGKPSIKDVGTDLSCPPDPSDQPA